MAQTIAPCLLCGTLAHRIHRHYEQTYPTCVSGSDTLILQVCKFFCPDTEYRRRIFTERLTEVAAPSARKAARFIQRLQSIGLAIGGAAGSQLRGLPLEGPYHRLGYASSGSTLLNYLHRLPLPTFKTPQALGIDDFASQKGHNYGTILIEWLQVHPGIEVLSHDRSKIT